MEKPRVDTIPLRALRRMIVAMPSIRRTRIREIAARRISSREVRSEEKTVVARLFAAIVR